MKTKVCSGECKLEKSISEFYPDKKSKDGLAYWCKDCVNKHSRKYYQKHKEKIKQRSKQQREEDPIAYKQYLKEYQQKEDNKKRRNKLSKEKYNTDINFKIKANLRTRLNRALHNNWKSGKTLDLLGCTVEELKTHLESQFKPGMSWDNYGFGKNKWNIDHIKPCASFDFSDPKQQQECFNYKNLQPLWAIDNIIKSNREI